MTHPNMPIALPITQVCIIITSKGKDVTIAKPIVESLVKAGGPFIN